jgi:hypothetical protein
MPQRVGDQGRLLGGVALGKPGCRRGGRGAAGIAGAHALEARLGEAASSSASTKNQAPLFFGSSCAQTSSSSLGMALSRA